MCESRQSATFEAAYSDPCQAETCTDRKVHSVDDLVPLLQKLAADMIALKYANTDRFSVCFAVREVVTNTLRRARRADRSNPVQVGFLVRPDYVLAEVIDADPTREPRHAANADQVQRLGKGLFMIRLWFYAERESAT